MGTTGTSGLPSAPHIPHLWLCFFAISVFLVGINEYLVYHAVFGGFGGGHPIVAVTVGRHLLEGLAAVVRNDAIKLVLEFKYLTGCDFNIRSLSL